MNKMLYVAASGIERASWVTRGADPTEVVTWTITTAIGKIELTEFQNVYGGTCLEAGTDRAEDVPEPMARTLHQALEAQYQDKWEKMQQGREW